MDIGCWVFSCCSLWALLLCALAARASTNLHTTWLWHLHQPIYWPDRRDWGGDHYEAAGDTIQQQNAGRLHPSPEVLSGIFGLADRVAAYQSRPHDALSSILGYANAGAQVNYSGALMEDVQSLGSNNQSGYARNWNTYNQQARARTTSAGRPRLDLVNFTHHHAHLRPVQDLRRPPTNYPPFALDGALGYPGYLLASNNLVLYGAVRGTTPYVATVSPGTSGTNDHLKLLP